MAAGVAPVHASTGWPWSAPACSWACARSPSSGRSSCPFNFNTDPAASDKIVYAGRPPVARRHPFGETGGLQRDVLHARRQRRAPLAADRRRRVASSARSSARSSAAIAGYFGGWLDNVLMRIVDIMLSLPLLFVILVVSKFLGQRQLVRDHDRSSACSAGRGSRASCAACSCPSARRTSWTRPAPSGVSDLRIIFRHILPNAMSPIIVATTLCVAGVIIGEAFVSFLGFGVDVDPAHLGQRPVERRWTFIPQGNWWWPFFPGLAIVLTVLGINFMGDGLRDALDPRAANDRARAAAGRGARPAAPPDLAARRPRPADLLPRHGRHRQGRRRRRLLASRAARRSGSSASRAAARASPRSRSCG